MQPDCCFSGFEMSETNLECDAHAQLLQLTQHQLEAMKGNQMVHNPLLHVDVHLVE